MSLEKFLAKRTIHGIFVIWGVITLTFFLRQFTPGNPVDLMVPESASAELREQVADDLGLNDPIHEQYAIYMVDLVQGDLGYSYHSGLPVNDLIIARMPATLELAVAASLLSIVIAIPLGIVSARYRYRSPDYFATSFSLLGISTPNFWLGIMLILLLSVQLGVFPTSTRGTGFGEGFWMLLDGNPYGLVDWLRYITLPAVTLGTYYTALITRLTRSGMLEEIGKQYMIALEAKGLPNRLRLYKHAFKNTLIPIVTILGLQIGGLIGGSVITEAVFTWPGLGTELISAINTRNWPVVQGTLIVVALGYVVMNIIVDATYAKLDPRVTN